MLIARSTMVRTAGGLGGYRACRWLTRSTPKILMYHRFADSPAPGCVEQSVFRQQVVYLQRHFRVSTLGQVLDEMTRTGRCAPGTVVITVDDGYRDFYDIAWPVLRECGVPATLFVTTRFVDGQLWLWPDALRYILDQSVVVARIDVPGFNGQEAVQLDDARRNLLWSRMVEYLLSIPEAGKQEWIRSFAARQAVRLGDAPEPGYRAVSWDQLREMQAGGLEIGAHTRTHPSLGKVEPAGLPLEIDGSLDDIERETGRRPVSFCYPNGQPEDYTEAVKAQVRKAGCLGAVTAFYDRAVTDDLFEMRRFSAGENRFQFEKSVNGVELLAARWLNTSNQATVPAC